MARLDPSIRHAISPPEFGEDKLHRADLVDRLHGEIPKKLIAIAAPAGYGKSTLLADFIAHTEIPVCYLRVTENEKDVFRLATVIFSSLEKRFRRLKGKFDIQAYQGSNPEALAISLTKLIDENIQEPFVIEIDDIHILNSEPETIAFFDSLIDRLPDQVTLISAGREVIEVSLAKLMAEGDLSGFGPHDIAFNLEETRDVIALKPGLDPSGVDVEALHSRTQGWVTGVLLAQSLSSSPLHAPWTEELGLVHEYLASVVLNRLPDRTRRFMLDTAVLPVMTSNICDELLEIDDSEQVLDELQRSGIFVFASGGSSEITYEYHPLFREFLLETQKAADPSRLKGLQARAADLLADQSPTQSFLLHIEAGNTSQAIELAGEYAPVLFREGRIRTLEKWYLLLEAREERSPELSLYLARAYSNRGDRNKASDILDQILDQTSKASSIGLEAILYRSLLYVRAGDYGTARERIQDIQLNHDLPDDDFQLQAQKHRIVGLIEQNNAPGSDAARAEIKDAIENYHQAGDVYYEATCYQDLAVIEKSAGRVEQALVAAEKAHGFLEEIGAPQPLANSFNDLGFLYYLKGDFTKALSYLNRGRRMAQDSASKLMEAAITFSIADIFSDCGMRVQAATMYEEGLLLSTSAGFEKLSEYGFIKTAVLHRRAGNTRHAIEWLNRAKDLTAGGGASSPELIVEMAAIQVQGNPQKAEQDLAALEAQFNEIPELLTKIHFFKALAQREAGLDSAKWLQAFQLAIDVAGINGFLQYLAAEIWAIQDLREVLSEESLRNIDGLLAQIEIMDLFSRSAGEKADQVEPPSRLEIAGMGEANVKLEGRLVDIKPQALEAFFYILDQGPVERDVLIEEFWEDHDPGRQTANLHMAIYSIRQSFGKDVVELEGTLYHISPGLDFTYDVAKFERAANVANSLSVGDPRLLFAITEAISAYQGLFLPNFYSDWVERRRRQLEMRYLDLIAAHADEALAKGLPSKSLDAIRKALEIDPYRDDLNLKYLQLLGRLGRRSDVIAHYQRYRDTIREELGLLPSAKIKEMYDRIVAM